MTFAARCSRCGAPLNQAATGRPRTTCSQPCRRAADDARKKLRRRLVAIAEWREVATNPGLVGFTRSFVRLRLRELRAEVDLLTREGLTP